MGSTGEIKVTVNAKIREIKVSLGPLQHRSSTVQDQIRVMCKERNYQSTQKFGAQNLYSHGTAI